MRTRMAMNRVCRVNRVTNMVSPPVASFSGTPLVLDNSGTQTCQFTDASTKAPASWLWECQVVPSGGWNTFSTSQNPLITGGLGQFVTPNVSYDIRLTATNAGGANTLTQLAYLVVNGA